MLTEMLHPGKGGGYRRACPGAEGGGGCSAERPTVKSLGRFAAFRSGPFANPEHDDHHWLCLCTSPNTCENCSMVMRGDLDLCHHVSRKQLQE